MKFKFRMLFETFSQFRQTQKHTTRQFIGSLLYTHEKSPAKICGDRPCLFVHPVYDKESSPKSSGHISNSDDQK